MDWQALLDFADPRDPSAPRWRWAFRAPREVLTTDRPEAVRAVLQAAQDHAAQGRWVVGGLRYEAAPAFDPALRVMQADDARPLAWFGVYDEAHPWPSDLPSADAGLQVAWHSAWSRSDFDRAMAQIHEAIAAGRYYQVNLTAQHVGTARPTEAAAPGAAWGALSMAWMQALRRAQPGGYHLWLNLGDEQVLSVSPELFFDWQGGQVLARPMKGTAARGRNPGEDAQRAQALVQDAKERAENVMIVDLLRNDLSRVAQPHSVAVPRLFHLEALPTVWQMTSDVVAQTRPDVGLADLFGALFPCGSVTGAPKVEAMAAICDLEAGPRGWYCGALGVLQPGGRATFNVPIRTAMVRDSEVRFGVGSGITSGARADAEWLEWQAKQSFLTRASEPFSLLETLRLQDGVYTHGESHLARLQRAARHFGGVWDERAVRQALGELGAQHASGRWRVRLLLDLEGRAQAQAFALEDSPARVRLALADRPFEAAHSEFVRFKTTRRSHYEAMAVSTPGVYDTLLWNPEGELTEGTRGNIACLIDGQWVTPALTCGLLDGVGREHALREGWLHEAVVRCEDLSRVQALAWLNSLRGVIPAELARP